MSSHDLTLLDTPLMATSHDRDTIALSLPVGCACGWSTTLVVVDPTPERIDVALG